MWLKHVLTGLRYFPHSRLSAAFAIRDTMVSALISRLVVLFLGTLYPAYGSYKAIRSKNAREYVHWIMYWICFAFFTFFETFSDIFLAFWIPFYYEMKILFLAWLLCPATRGSAVLYKNFVHPRLVKHEQEIDEMIETAKQNGVSAMYQLGTRGAQYASQLLATTALKGQQVLLKQIQRSYSQGDVTDAAAVLGPGEEVITYRRAASRNLNTRKTIRSEPAFSDEEEDNFQIDEAEFAIVEEHDSPMDIGDEPPKLPTKKKGTFKAGDRKARRVYLEEDSELSENDDSSESSRASADSHGMASRRQDDSDSDWKPVTRSKVQRKAALRKSPKPCSSSNLNNNNLNDTKRKVR